MIFIDPVEITPGSAGAWIDIDVSSYVPAGATGVVLHFVNTHASNYYYIGQRKNGSTDNRYGQLFSDCHTWSAIGIDANRVLEAYVGNTTSIDIYIVGYYTSDAVFNTNAVDKSLSNTGAWYDIDISGDTGADTATGAILEIKGSTSNRAL